MAFGSAGPLRYPDNSRKYIMLRDIPIVSCIDHYNDPDNDY